MLCLKEGQREEDWYYVVLVLLCIGYQDKWVVSSSITTHTYNRIRRAFVTKTPSSTTHSATSSVVLRLLMVWTKVRVEECFKICDKLKKQIAWSESYRYGCDMNSTVQTLHQGSITSLLNYNISAAFEWLEEGHDDAPDVLQTLTCRHPCRRLFRLWMTLYWALNYWLVASSRYWWIAASWEVSTMY